MNIVYLKGGAFDGNTYKKGSNDSSTIRIPYKNRVGKDVTDVYMKVLNYSKVVNDESLEVYLYRETIKN